MTRRLIPTLWLLGLGLPVAFGQEPATVMLPPGPWGLIEVAPLPLEPPDPALEQQDYPQGQEWAVNAPDDAAVDGFLARAGLPAATRQRLLTLGRRDAEYPSFWAPDDIRLNLTPRERVLLYDWLGLYWRNPFHVVPIPLPPRDHPAWAEAALNPALEARLHQLTFERRGLFCLVDGDLLPPLVRDHAEALRLKRLLAFSPALQLDLKRESLAQGESLSRYWTLPGIRPARETLGWFDRSPALDAIGVWNLLPDNARQLFNTFLPPQPDGRMVNCFWASLNFTAANPDDRLLASGRIDDACADYAYEVLQRDYERVSADFRFGDIIALSNTVGDTTMLIHVMVYIAADVVLTKNGCAPTQPLVFMRINDVERYYPTPRVLQISVWRRRGVTPPVPDS